jgi:hypothetical protein
LNRTEEARRWLQRMRDLAEVLSPAERQRHEIAREAEELLGSPR